MGQGSFLFGLASHPVSQKLKIQGAIRSHTININSQRRQYENRTQQAQPKMAATFQPQGQGRQQGTVRTGAKCTAHSPLQGYTVSQLWLTVAPENYGLVGWCCHLWLFQEKSDFWIFIVRSSNFYTLAASFGLHSAW